MSHRCYGAGLFPVRSGNLSVIYTCRNGNRVIILGFLKLLTGSGYPTRSFLVIFPLQLSLPGCSATPFSSHEQVSPEGV
jgi:hypothetical protein